MEPKDANGLTEREFLLAYAKKNYPRPYLTADVVVLTKDGREVLLVRRKGHPFLGCWALPGGFAKADETLEQSAARELFEETGVRRKDSAMEPVGLYSTPGRDPRGWVVTQAYLAVVDRAEITLCAADDAAEAAWFTVTAEKDRSCRLTNGKTQLTCRAEQSDLAFDHGRILLDALEKISFSA